ncbi:MAG: hypothetical protein H0T46_19965 [Deltaproteobacteria bacterium]|nr:hypothetical protein [Deltaproteobacteria bacterium]
MGDHDKTEALKGATVDVNVRPLPPAPKNDRPKQLPRRVPTAGDLISPSADVDARGMPSKVVYAMVENHVDLIHRQLDAASKLAISRLEDPPPAADQPMALRAMKFLAETLASLALGRVGQDLIGMVGKGFSKETTDAVKDQLKSLSGKAATGAAGLLTADLTKNDSGGAAPPPTNPAAGSLVEEFAARFKLALDSTHVRALDNLAIAVGSVEETTPDEIHPLLDELRRYSTSSNLGAWLQAEIAIGWLNFSAAISLGRRAPAQTIMPDANKLGGSRSAAWRQQHEGFMEIDIDVPDRIDGMNGVAVGSISIRSGGPGAAHILRAYSEEPAGHRSPAAADAAAGTAAINKAFNVPVPELPTGLSLATLPVYRRLWLGRNRSDRMPDIVIGPDHHVEVNENSSLLAALATGESGGFLDIQGRGREEETKQAALVERAREPAPDLTGVDGPLGGTRPTPPRGMSDPEQFRLARFSGNLVTRSRDARLGAEKIIRELLSKATTSQISS